MTALEEALQQNGTVEFHVHGKSMYPTLRKGDALTISKFEGTLHKGQIAVYFKDDYPMVRRVKGYGADGYYLKGDNSSRVHDLADYEIKGVLVKVVRDGKEIDPHSFGVKVHCFFYRLGSPFRKLGEKISAKFPKKKHQR